MVKSAQRQPGLKKLPVTYNRIMMPLVLSVFMSGIVSAVATSISVGLGSGFAMNWPNAWGASWLVAFPSLLVVLPVTRRIVAAVVEQPK